LTRFYTTVFCYAAKNVKIRENMLRQYETKKISKKENDLRTDYENENEVEKESVMSINSYQKNKSVQKSISGESSNILPLCIKNYKTPNGLSNYIHTHLDEEFFIHGNYVKFYNINGFYFFSI
jgi:hypothetical protein